METKEYKDIERQRNEGSDRLRLMKFLSARALENFKKKSIFRKLAKEEGCLR